MKYKHFCHVGTTVPQHHTCWTFIYYTKSASVALGYLWLIPDNSLNFANI